MRRLARWFSAADLFALLLLAYALAVGARAGIPLSLNLLYAWQALLLTYLSAVVLGLPYIGAFVLAEDRRLIREEGAGRSLWQTLRSLRSRYQPGRHAWEVARFILVMNFVLVLHYNLHPRVPHINPALYDEAFRQLDILLFLGTDPVRYMTQHPVFAHPLFCAFMDRAYVLWYPVKLLVAAWFLFQPDLAELRRFSSALVFMWASHIVVVLLWPSLGPAFITPEWFHGLNLPVAQAIQAELLEGYRLVLENPAASVRQFEGISGFPSLHVGLVGMFALFLWRHSRLAGGVMWAYTLVTFIGSGLTGWHYLCDGIAGMVMALVAFGLTRWLYPLHAEPGAGTATRPRPSDAAR